MRSFTRVETTIPTFLIMLLSPMYNKKYIYTSIGSRLIFFRTSFFSEVMFIDNVFKIENH